MPFTSTAVGLLSTRGSLEGARHSHVVFANYQETKLRHFHSLLDKYIAA